jgi:histidinol-phosphatase (PHP family)
MDLKQIVDCHVHSHFSCDSRIAIKNLVARAMKVGLGGITVTDHADLDYPNQLSQPGFDFEGRARILNELKKEFAGKFLVLQGIELGFQPQIVKEASKLVQDNYFDFVINSTHVVDRIDVCRRPLNESWTKEQVYRRYLTAIYDSVTMFDDFDVVGHIGFITRYVPYEDPHMRYEDYADIIDMILKALIEKGKGFEVNSAGYSYKLNTPHPGFDILQRYKELGGEILTLGSDSHVLEQIGDHFTEVIQKLALIGFKHVCYFVNRKPVFVKI